MAELLDRHPPRCDTGIRSLVIRLSIEPARVCDGAVVVRRAEAGMLMKRTSR